MFHTCLLVGASEVGSVGAVREGGLSGKAQLGVSPGRAPREGGLGRRGSASAVSAGGEASCSAVGRGVAGGGGAGRLGLRRAVLSKIMYSKPRVRQGDSHINPMSSNTLPLTSKIV